MNWLTKGKFGLIALSALFLACENDDLLSLDFDPQDENLNLSFTEFTVPFQLVQRDSLSTTNVNLLVGNYQNNVFGTVKSTGYVDMSLSASAVNNAEETDRLDSLVLYTIKNYSYGDLSSNLQQTINIHRLSEPFNDTIIYYQNSSIPYEPNAIGSLSFTVDPEEPTDTLRTRLSDDLGNELLDKLKADAIELDSNALFQDYFKGLAFVPASENTFVSGFRMHESGGTGTLIMTLYYSSPEDTASHAFSMNITTRYSNNNSTSFNGVEVDRSGTALANLTQPRQIGSAADNRFYMQSTTGLVSRLDMQPLLNFVEEHENQVLLNRVILHIGLTEPEESRPSPAALYGFQLQDDGFTRHTAYNTQQGLFYAGVYSDDDYRYNDIDNHPYQVNASAIPFDTTNIAYNLRLTSFAQNLVDGFIENPEILIQPNDITTGMSQMTTEPDSIKLRVYYTILN